MPLPPNSALRSLPLKFEPSEVKSTNGATWMPLRNSFENCTLARVFWNTSSSGASPRSCAVQAARSAATSPAGSGCRRSRAKAALRKSCRIWRSCAACDGLQAMSAFSTFSCDPRFGLTAVELIDLRALAARRQRQDLPQQVDGAARRGDVGAGLVDEVVELAPLVALVFLARLGQLLDAVAVFDAAGDGGVEDAGLLLGEAGQPVGAGRAQLDRRVVAQRQAERLFEADAVGAEGDDRQRLRPAARR